MQFHSKNFFKNTYCEFKQVDFNFSTVEKFKSKSGSTYHYTEKGVYRYSNHWGRVANCRWKLLKTKNYKNQQWCVGYANWLDFFDLQSTEKYFFIEVKIIPEEICVKVENDIENSTKFLFSIQQALERKKEIQQIFINKKWLKYLDEDAEKVQEKVICQLINSTTSLQEIKNNFREV